MFYVEFSRRHGQTFIGHGRWLNVKRATRLHFGVQYPTALPPFAEESNSSTIEQFDWNNHHDVEQIGIRHEVDRSAIPMKLRSR